MRAVLVELGLHRTDSAFQVDNRATGEERSSSMPVPMLCIVGIYDPHHEHRILGRLHAVGRAGLLGGLHEGLQQLSPRAVVQEHEARVRLLVADVVAGESPAVAVSTAIHARGPVLDRRSPSGRVRGPPAAAVRGRDDDGRDADAILTFQEPHGRRHIDPSIVGEDQLASVEVAQSGLFRGHVAVLALALIGPIHEEVPVEVPLASNVRGNSGQED
mmetsp:Transcript_117535/g.374502  ORF Transcript_117535/g.374502 Transcript_117535/m.374502 type:complete len:216 (+) Transcript_117535:302-949(+)